MINILLLLFVSAIAVLLIMLLSTWYMNFLLRNYIGKKHKLIEYIIQTSEVPESWSKGYNKKIAKIGKKAENKDKITCILQKAQTSYLSKLNILIKYLKTTTMVENEDIRNELVSQLQEIRNQWERGTSETWIQNWNR